MSIASALFAATSGLAAARARIDVVSQNVANAATDHTLGNRSNSRRIVGEQAQGVDLGVVMRTVNEGLQRDIRSQQAIVSELTVLDNYLDRLVESFGRPEDNRSIAAKITGLKEKIQAFSITPELGASQAEVLRVAASVAAEFQELTQMISNLRKEADRQIADTVELVNTALDNIEALNDSIAIRKTQG